MKAEIREKFETLQNAAAESKAKIVAEKKVLDGIRKEMQAVKAELKADK